MTALGPKITWLDPEDSLNVMIHPASPEIAMKVIEASVDDHDGRSEFLWVRLPNGDLILGVYPQGDTYCDCERDAQFPQEHLPELLWCESCGERPQLVRTKHTGLCTICAAAVIDSD